MTAVCWWHSEDHGPDEPAVTEVIVIRPCGHDRKTVPSCLPCHDEVCADRFASTVTSCPECGHIGRTEAYSPLAGDDRTRLEALRRACAIDGHDYEHVLDGGAGLVRVICGRCDATWKVVPA